MGGKKRRGWIVKSRGTLATAVHNELGKLHYKYWTQLLVNIQIIWLQSFLIKLNNEFSTIATIRGREISTKQRQLTAVNPKGFRIDW
jgi:hypothetical protein